jgi:hypothetical protein
VSIQVSRTLTFVAIAVLAFDGALLIALGVWAGRVVLVLVGVVFFVSSAVILWYWRWYRRRLEDIAATRRGLAEEVREMQRLLREK